MSRYKLPRTPDCFIYALVDPRYDRDLIKGIRYIGQTSTGIYRPREHTGKYETSHGSNQRPLLPMSNIQRHARCVGACSTHPSPFAVTARGSSTPMLSV